MTSWVALLRGINVSGKNIIKMKELRESFSSRVFLDIKTHLQSGNIVWSSNDEKDSEEWGAIVSDHIQKHFGISVPVMCYNSEEWDDIFNSLPWPEIAETQGNKVLIGCFSDPSKVETDLSFLRKYSDDDDLIQWKDPALFIHFANGMGRSKLSIDKLEKWANGHMTTRNWNTVRAIQEMLSNRPV